MDKLDIRIVRNVLESEATSPLDFNPKKSYSHIAKRLKVDENTVKNRIDRLYESGFLRGWWLAVNPNLVGQGMAQIWIDLKVSTSKGKAVENVSLLQGVAVIKDHFGDSICIVLYHEGEQALRRAEELILKLVEANSVTSAKEPFPKCEVVISNDDCRIIESIQSNPLKPYSKIAAELDLSPKTIKRRISRLSEAGALYVVAELNPEFLTGGLVCGMLVFYKNIEERYELNKKILDHIEMQLLFANVDDSQHGYFAFVVTNLARASEALAFARSLEGITGARLDLVQRVISLYEVYKDQVRRLRQSE